MMHTTLQAVFEQIEQQRQAVLAPLRGLSPGQLTQPPGPGKWTVMQILAHVVTAEKLSVSYLNKKILGVGEAGDTGWQEDLRMVLLKASQRLPLKFKAPGRVVESTPAYASLDELRSEWNQVRAQLAATLERFPQHHLKRKVYKHPFVGMINIKQMLVFFREHVIHHQPQIRRALKAG